MTAKELLEQVKNGTLSTEDAERILQNQPYENMGYARLDLHRQTRTGYPETVYCEGKETAFLTEICRTLYERNGAVLGTRASEDQARAVRDVLPGIEYDPVSRILRLESEEFRKRRGEPAGSVAVCCGGTSDVPIAEEAAQTAEYLGAKVERIYDIGVTGLHRILAVLDRLRAANAIVAAAGMEGTLPGVIAGLVENPVIAVPTSVGYGANLGGLSALLTMLNSCANGITVVNIDNGYGAGYSAAQINRLALRTRD